MNHAATDGRFKSIRLCSRSVSIWLLSHWLLLFGLPLLLTPRP